MPTSVANEGASHFRHVQNACVIHANNSAQRGSRINECVMLRCHVTISNLSCENMSRKTSESGKIAPTISDQVTMRSRVVRCSGRSLGPFISATYVRPGPAPDMSSPRNSAFAMRAPAMPWVIVSILECGSNAAAFWQSRSSNPRNSKTFLGLLNQDQRLALGNHHADAPRGNTVFIQRGERIVTKLRRDSHQQATRRLWIHQQIAKLLRNGFRKAHAIAKEFAIVFQPAREKSFARCLLRSRHVANRRVIDLQRHGLNLLC